MTNVNEKSQPENILDMRSIRIALPGVESVRAEEDIDRIARQTGELKLAFTAGPDGADAQLGAFQLNINQDRVSVTRQLAADPALVEPVIQATCRIVAAILDGAQDAVTIPVVQMDAIAAVSPELGRALESGVVEPATTRGGKEIGVWHRLTPRRDAEPTGRFGFDYHYRAVTSVAVGRISARQTLEDAALTVMGEMVRLANLDAVPELGEMDADDMLALLGDIGFFESVLSVFPGSDYHTKACALNAVAKAVTAGHLTVPDGALGPTLNELRRLSQGYSGSDAGHPDRADAMESRNQRSIVLLEQIRRRNWPAGDGDGDAE